MNKEPAVLPAVNAGKGCRGYTMKTMSHYQILKGRAKDLDGILICLRMAFERYRTQYSPQGFANTVLDSETIKRRMCQMCVVIAVSEERVIGTISYGVNGTEGHLRGVAVSPEWQGTGVAAGVLRAAENEPRNKRSTFVTLDTTAPQAMDEPSKSNHI